MIYPIPFYMIRHGQTEANAARIMAGSLDSPLTDLGRQQARAAIHALEHLPVKPRTIVHSPLGRARETAMILNEALKLPMHEDADIAELHAGDWEGASYDVCPGLMEDWIDPPNGEMFASFFARITRAKNRILKGFPGPALLVTHGGVFRAFGKIYGLNSTGVENCHLHEFEPNAARPHFPWTIWQYDLLPAPVRTPAQVYARALSETSLQMRSA